MDGGPVDGGVPSDAPRARGLDDLVREGTSTRSAAPRPAFVTLAIRGPVTLEVQQRPDGTLVRRVRHDAGWQQMEGAAEVFHDVVVHPSGEVTLAVEHADRSERGYALRRLDARGQVLDEAPLTADTLSEAEREGLPPLPMRAFELTALQGGWISLAARGEDLIVLFQSRAVLASNEVVLGVSWLARRADRYVETRTRLVDGRHTIQAAGWNYDEFRWIDTLLRPLLAVDPTDGAVVVGRAFTQGRCRQLVARFSEFTTADCYARASGNSESRVLPFVFTTFDADGARLGSHAYLPEGGFYYGIAAMAASHGEVALAGAVAMENDEGALSLYPATPDAQAIMVPFDALLSVLDRERGAVLRERHIDRGRGDALLAVHYVGRELLAVGATDWDRHDFGMSVSRGSDPLLVHLTAEGVVTDRAFEEGDAGWPIRHALFYDVAIEGAELRVVGALDAPMTHSGDGGNTAATTFGALQIQLH